MLWSLANENSLGLGFGDSRFGDNRRHLAATDRFKVLYASLDPKACFLETVIRDRRQHPLVLPDTVVRRYRCLHLLVLRPLRLLDLTGDAPTLMRVPTDVRSWSNHSLSQAWALAIHEHPARVDGIRYPCRHDETLINIALFDRAFSGPQGPALRIVADPWPDYDALIDALLERYGIREIADMDTASMPDPDETVP